LQSEYSAEVEGLIAKEIARLRMKPRWDVAFETLGNGVGRFLIRSARVAAGVLLGLVSLWLLDAAGESLDKPFAALTLRDLAKLIFFCVLGLWALGGAFGVAFGAAPKREALSVNDDRALREKATHIVLRRLQSEGAIADELKKQADRAARWYRHGKVIGVLFDPTLAKRHPWVPIVAVVLGYGLLLAFIFSIEALR
jgi:hypothetical protein